MENNIATIRKRKAIMQKDLAKMVGIYPTSMSKVERGKRGASRQLLERIAKQLDVSIKDIFLD